MEAGEIRDDRGPAAGCAHESRLLARHERRPRRAGPRSEDPQPARRDRQDHLDRDLRLRPAPLRRLHPDDEDGATSSATSSWARSSRSAPRSTNLKVGDRVVVPFTIACGSCFFCEQRAVVALRQLEPERLDGREAVRLLAAAGLFGYSHMTGGYAGGQARVRARAVRRRRPDQGARRPDRRAGAVPLRHLPDRLHGRRELQHPAGRHRRGLGLRAGRPVRDRRAPGCSAPSG